MLKIFSIEKRQNGNNLKRFAIERPNMKMLLVCGGHYMNNSDSNLIVLIWKNTAQHKFIISSSDDSPLTRLLKSVLSIPINCLLI